MLGDKNWDEREGDSYKTAHSVRTDLVTVPGDKKPLPVSYSYFRCRLVAWSPGRLVAWSPGRLVLDNKNPGGFLFLRADGFTFSEYLLTALRPAF